MGIDWDNISSKHIIRPNNNDIIQIARGDIKSPPAYQYLNWAFKIVEEERFVNLGSMGPTSGDFGILIRACQKVVKEENLQYIPEPEPGTKKRGWFF